ALIIVGTLMMSGARELSWDQMDEAIPAFLAVIIMPLTYSIANGITLGIVTYVLLKLIVGKGKEISPVMIVLAILLAAYYADLGSILGLNGETPPAE
ncbi:MAG: hypothetical protein ACR2RF_14060, partial [Geminicoccaceae bacterium]